MGNSLHRDRCEGLPFFNGAKTENVTCRIQNRYITQIKVGICNTNSPKHKIIENKVFFVNQKVSLTLWRKV